MRVTIRRLAGAAAAVGLLLAAGCGGNEVDAATPDARVPVRVEPVERRPLVHTVTLSGRLRANAVVEVQPKVTGRIVTFHKREGDAVAAGELLVELDTTELRLEFQRAEAVLAQAGARRDEARRKRQRARELFDRNVLSQANLDSADAEARIAEADWKTAVAGRDLARQRLSDARIVAPIDGVLQDRQHSVGDLVAPGFGGGDPSDRSGSGMRGPIFTVIQSDPLLLEVNVPEQDANRVRHTDEDVPVTVDALGGEEFIGTVEYVAPSLDPVAFTQQVRLRVPNPDGRLKPGMFARMEAVRDVAEDDLVVPADALVDLGDTWGVYVVDESHTARLRQVQTRFLAGNQAAVARGLDEGEQVIVEGKSSVREGTEVRLVNPERPAGP